MSSLLERLHIPRFEFAPKERGDRVYSPVATYYLIVIPALILTVFGLVMGFSASAVTTIASGGSPYAAFLRQLLIIGVSFLLAAIFVQRIPSAVWYRLAPAIYLAALFFQALVMTPLAASQGGNTNWVSLPGLGTFQPSEFLKLALIVALGRSLSRQGARRNDWRQMAVTVGLPILGALVDVMLGKDMGTAMVMAAGAFGAIWVARLPRKWFAVIFLSAIPVVVFLVFQNPTRMKRILAVLPWNRPARNLSAPEQIDHALWALGSGGLTGLGPGASREKWNYLQAAHTDFILAIIGEEFGLLGTLTIVACICLMIWGMVRLIHSSNSFFATIVSGGVAAWIGIQAIINIASVTGLGPVIGVPLPLVSYGGSSYLFTISAIALVAACARENAGMTMGLKFSAGSSRDPRLSRRRRRAGKASGGSTEGTR
ncbi:putative peptidoglycan glycosyltransferase FtsW [uncultured Actinomyces sp.]|uniref:FtsW/RodA/SpoVE family cell cycle protein n=1 Tax=uncultured Actinomyces sp. TaxID=249061 RepID=UPI0028D1B31D|nr:putative peptidoglycan glycosyltransferase FtsW [uncultured Actinomyces sp.]